MIEYKTRTSTRSRRGK